MISYRQFFQAAVSLTPSSVSGQSTSEQTFAVAGLAPGDAVWVSPPARTNNTALAGARVSAPNTLALTFTNPTTGALTPPAGIYIVGAMR
jgi:hypothetical protein